MALEARINAPDPLVALLDCARHDVPGPLVADNDCSCGLVHVDVLDDDAIDALTIWGYEPRTQLVDVVELSQ